MFNIIYYILIIALGSHQNVQRMVPQCSTVAPLGLGPKGLPNPGNFPPLQEVSPYNFKALTRVRIDSPQLRGQVANMWRS